MKNEREDTQTWPDLAVGLCDRLTGRGAEISYEMKDPEVLVLSNAGADANTAKWTLNETVKITTRDQDVS